MVVIVGGVVVTLQTNLPASEWLELKHQLLEQLVCGGFVQSAIFHLDNLIAMHIVSVWVIDRIGRPTACDVMEEKSRHVRWTTECLAVPLVAVRDGEPLGDVSVHLRCKVVLVEYILTVAYQSVLIKPCTTYIVVDVLHTTANRNVMLL